MKTWFDFFIDLLFPRGKWMPLHGVIEVEVRMHEGKPLELRKTKHAKNDGLLWSRASMALIFPPYRLSNEEIKKLIRWL